MHVLLLRHAQSTWNAEGRWQGRADPPLSADGEADAHRLGQAAALGELGAVTGIVSSDLARARHTAEILAGHLGVGPVELFAGLRERDVGDFTGHTRAEIAQRWPGVLEPPRAESRRAVLARALGTLHRVADRHPGGRIIAVTHGALIRAVEAHVGHVEPGPPRNLTGRWLHVEGGDVTPIEPDALACGT